MTHALKWLSLPALLLLLSTSCAGKQKETTQPLPTGPTSLRIENQNWLDVTIYVVHDGQRSRLGAATAARTTNMAIPPNLLGQLGAIRLVADPVALVLDRQLERGIRVGAAEGADAIRAQDP